MVYDKSKARALYKRLIIFYPRAFKEQLGESMEQTFNDLYKEKRQTKKELFSFVLWTFIETSIGIFREHLLIIFQEILCKPYLEPSDHRRASAFCSSFRSWPWKSSIGDNSMKISLSCCFSSCGSTCPQSVSSYCRLCGPGGQETMTWRTPFPHKETLSSQTPSRL